MNKNLDNAADWRDAAREALRLGLVHPETGVSKMSSQKLLSTLQECLGWFRYRNFHASSLHRIYSGAYDGIGKMRLVRRQEPFRAFLNKVAAGV